MPTNPASEAVNLNTLKELAWKLRGEKWEYRYSPNCTEPHSVQGKSASICHTPWNTGNEETIMRFIAEAKNFLTHETISRLESLEAAVAKVEAERDELRETMAESCCSKLEANQRIANAQAEAASVFVPELRDAILGFFRAIKICRREGYDPHAVMEIVLKQTDEWGLLDE